MRVLAFTGRICHMYANIVHVREQWRHWQDCMHATSSLSIGWKNMSYIRPFIYVFESSGGSGETACMVRCVWAFTDGICQMYAHFVHVREQWRLWQDCMHASSSLSIGWKNMPYVHPLMCMCERSEGSGETACTLRRVWAFTGRICHIYANIVHVREQWRHWQDCMHATSSLSIGWKNMSYIRPFIYVFESSEGSGETACMLRRVWAFTDGICQMYAHFVHVREQWRLWWDCMYGQVRLSINWWNMPNVCPFCAWARPVKALTRLHACLF